MKWRPIELAPQWVGIRLKNEDLTPRSFLFARYGAPDSIRMDNGPDMTSRDVIDWAAAKGIRPASRRATPAQFHGLARSAP